MVTVKVVSKDEWVASAIFNPNAFPEPLKKAASSCVVRAGILRFHVRSSESFIQADRTELVNFIKDHWETQFKPVLSKDSKADAWVQLAGMGSLTAIDGVLLSLKSLLDVFSTIVSTSFVQGQRIQFNRKVINDSSRQLSGGRLISWLRQNVPNEYSEIAISISDIILKHSNEWITDTVVQRDEIVHFGQLTCFKPVGTTLRIFSDTNFNINGLSGPYIHDESIDDYCKRILSNAGTLFDEVISLLPSVDKDIIKTGIYGQL